MRRVRRGHRQPNGLRAGQASRWRRGTVRRVRRGRRQPDGLRGERASSLVRGMVFECGQGPAAGRNGQVLVLTTGQSMVDLEVGRGFTAVIKSSEAHATHYNYVRFQVLLENVPFK